MQGGKNKFSYEKVKNIFEQHGFQLLEREYQSNNAPMRAICSCGEEISIRLSDVQYGRKCQKCKAKKSSERNKTTDEEIFRICNDSGCHLIRSWIVARKTRIEYVCKCGLTAEAYLTNFKRFPNCWQCGKAKKSGENCYRYDPDREAVALRRKFRKTCNNMIRRFMKATGGTKSKKSEELLGYTPQELQDHILNHPDYKSCSGGKWHVDHIFPIQAFLDHGILDLKIVNALCNLRPLPGPENLKKAAVYDEKEFKECLRSLRLKK